MGGLSERDIAERAGVDLDYVTKLAEAGVLTPDGGGRYSEGDTRRARLYHGLERRD